METRITQYGFNIVLVNTASMLPAQYTYVWHQAMPGI